MMDKSELIDELRDDLASRRLTDKEFNGILNSFISYYNDDSYSLDSLSINIGISVDDIYRKYLYYLKDKHKN